MEPSGQNSDIDAEEMIPRATVAERSRDLCSLHTTQTLTHPAGGSGDSHATERNAEARKDERTPQEHVTQKRGR